MKKRFMQFPNTGSFAGNSQSNSLKTKSSVR
jgi:hypothetical protein